MEFTRYSSLSGSNVAFVAGRLTTRQAGCGRSETKLKALNPGLRTPMYPYVVLCCPTYRENSHANHTWNPQLRQTTYFKDSEAMPVWVRFPSPAPIPPKCWSHMSEAIAALVWLC
jgi:hypothetical protein